MYVENLRNLPSPAFSVSKKLENLKGIIKCNWSIVLNDTCLNKNILHNFQWLNFVWPMYYGLGSSQSFTE